MMSLTLYSEAQALRFLGHQISCVDGWLNMCFFHWLAQQWRSRKNTEVAYGMRMMPELWIHA